VAVRGQSGGSSVVRRYRDKFKRRRMPPAALYDSSNTIHLFAVGMDGRVYATFAEPGQAWPGWGSVSTGVFAQAAHVSALSGNGNSIHLFALGLDRRVYTTFAGPGQVWPEWGSVSTGVFSR
jgi:hypothetical protein